MNLKTILPFMILALMAVWLVACSGGAADSTGGASSTTAASERPDPPEEYASLKNPLEGEAEAISAGESLYQANCSSCHGATGEGDGPAASGLNPKPKNLAQGQTSMEDSYLYWRIAEGGLMEPFNSVMPAWRGLLEEEQIWQIITYIRTFG
jgi:mono/diheme cytochrome c family protein